MTQSPWSEGLWAWRSATVLAALTLGLTFAHTLELPRKLQFSAQLWTTLNQRLYEYFAVVGGALEVVTVLMLAMLAVAELRRSRSRRWAVLVAAGCFAAALVVYFMVVQPANDQIASWSPASVPSDWTTWRDRWEFGHAFRFGLMLIGFAALVAAVTGREPADRAGSRSARRAEAEAARRLA